ncbi:hypothetical protein LQW54_005086 [Pestalotiopsis sp. IQ-011]
MAAVTLPNISYYPSERQANSFWETIPRSFPDITRVPLGFPEKLKSPLAWKASDIKAHLSDYVIKLSLEDVAHVETALFSFKEMSLETSALSARTFRLPQELAGRLKAVSAECYSGVGFNIIRGLDPAKYSAADNVIIYAGIASHVAPERGFIDRKRESVISHLLNVSSAVTPAYTLEKVAFHSDNSEIMGLYVLESAHSGGKLSLSSSFDLYNKLALNHPGVLETLASPWVLDTFKDYAKYPPLRMPFLHRAGTDKIIFRFSRYPLTGFQGLKRNPSLPALTEAQVKALDAVQFMAAANSIEIPMMKGDILFVNDQAIMHARGSFSDKDFAQRHLLKMFLRDPERSWSVSGVALEQRQKIYGANQVDGSRVETWWTDFEQGQEGESPTNG